MAIDIEKIKKNGQINLLDIFVFISLLLEVILCIVQSLGVSSDVNEVLFFNTYALLISIVAYFLFVGFNKHFLIFAYFLCFAIFLMGQKVFRYIQNGGYDEFLTFEFLKLNKDQYFIFTQIMYFSLLTVFIGYRCGIAVIGKKYAFKNSVRQSEKGSESYLISCRTILSILLFICFICSIIMQIKIIKAKSSVSYTDSYLINVDVNPIIKIGNYLFVGIVFLYLGTRPSKRQALAALTLFMIVEGGMQLLIGRRALLAKAVLFIVWYLICYYKFDRKKMPYKYFILLFILAILMILLFWLIERSRSNGKEEFDFFKAISSFFISTGGSDSVIANTIDKADQFPKQGIVYLLYPIKDAITDNVLVRKILEISTGVSVPTYAQGLDYVNTHDSFSHWISYLVNSDLYCKGYGMGSSYLAELFLAFGLFGVALGGIVLGIVIAKFSLVDLRSPNLYKKAFVMFFIYNLFTLPRSGAFETSTNLLYFICALLGFKTICFVLGVRRRRGNNG